MVRWGGVVATNGQLQAGGWREPRRRSLRLGGEPWIVHPCCAHIRSQIWWSLSRHHSCQAHQDQGGTQVRKCFLKKGARRERSGRPRARCRRPGFAGPHSVRCSAAEQHLLRERCTGAAKADGKLRREHTEAAGESPAAARACLSRTPGEWRQCYKGAHGAMARVSKTPRRAGGEGGVGGRRQSRLSAACTRTLVHCPRLCACTVRCAPKRRPLGQTAGQPSRRRTKVHAVSVQCTHVRLAPHRRWSSARAVGHLGQLAVLGGGFLEGPTDHPHRAVPGIGGV